MRIHSNIILLELEPCYVSSLCYEVFSYDVHSVVIFCARDALLKTSVIHNLHNSRHVLKYVFFFFVHYFKLCT
jgi:hypothetical protein